MKKFILIFKPQASGFETFSHFLIVPNVQFILIRNSIMKQSKV